jgi:hypothetical protein
MPNFSYFGTICAPMKSDIERGQQASNIVEMKAPH